MAREPVVMVVAWELAISSRASLDPFHAFRPYFCLEFGTSLHLVILLISKDALLIRCVYWGGHLDHSLGQLLPAAITLLM